MLRIRNLTFSYKHVDSPALKNVNLKIESGKFALIEGSTGSGKSTLLKAIIGLVPHFTGGKLKGSIEIDGKEVTRLQPHEIAESVAYVNQQPEAAFATDTVEEELVFGLEQLGWAPQDMTRRLGELSLRFGLENLLRSQMSELSGGQQQRVAIASALAAGQKLLLLDEPTSALDGASANSLIQLLSELSRQDGITILIAEHRIERVLPFIDQVVTVESDGSLTNGIKPALEVRELSAKKQSRSAGKETFVCSGLSKSYSTGFTLKAAELIFSTNQITGVFGDNGSGKTTLLWAVLEEALKQGVEVAMIPQNAQDLLFLSSVADELAEADSRISPDGRRAARYLENLVGRLDPFKHPRDLSAGQQLALVLAIQLSSGAKTLIMDEPTRGLDARAKQSLATSLHELRDQGHSIVLATHDREFLAEVADRLLVVANGTVSEAGDPL